MTKPSRRRPAAAPVQGLPSRGPARRLADRRGPHDLGQHTVALTMEIADWISELARAELDDLQTIEGDDQGDAGDQAPEPVETWFG